MYLPTRRSTHRRLLFAGLAAALTAGLAGVAQAAGPAAPGAPGAGCQSRLLVLSAMPLELDPLLAAASIDQRATVNVDGRSFYLGRLRGNDVVLALTHIGLQNAEHTAEDAFRTFRCGDRTAISAVVFSGTSGGDYIGDVMVPARWTENGRTWVATDPAMLATMRQVLRRHPPRLEQDTPTGDPACSCLATSGAMTPVRVEHTPVVEIGGNGLSTDPFGGRTFPCAPTGSDVFGCVPCRESNTAPVAQTRRFVQDAVPFANPQFFTGYEAASAPPPGNYVEQDMETAAVFQVAARYHVPFIGFRAASDGGGDPLHLPGFPAEFFVYRQLAADNAASTALAFLSAWATSHPASASG